MQDSPTIRLHERATTDTGDERGNCCPFASPSVNLACMALLRERNAAPLREVWRSSIERTLPTLATFIDGTIVWIVSQQWWDLFSIYIVRFRNRPFCACTDANASPPAPDTGVPSIRLLADMSTVTRLPQACSTDLPPWSKRYVFAFGLLLTLGTLVIVLERIERRTAWRSLRIVPSMSAMTIGWALGDASVELLRTLNNDSLAANVCHSCNLLNIAVSFAATFFTAFIMLVLQPLARTRLTDAQRESSRWVSVVMLRVWVAGVCDQAVRGLKYNVMILCEPPTNQPGALPPRHRPGLHPGPQPPRLAALRAKCDPSHRSHLLASPHISSTSPHISSRLLASARSPLTSERTVTASAALPFSGPLDRLLPA